MFEKDGEQTISETAAIHIMLGKVTTEKEAKGAEIKKCTRNLIGEIDVLAKKMSDNLYQGVRASDSKGVKISLRSIIQDLDNDNDEAVNMRANEWADSKQMPECNSRETIIEYIRLSVEEQMIYALLSQQPAAGEG